MAAQYCIHRRDKIKSEYVRLWPKLNGKFKDHCWSFEHKTMRIVLFKQMKDKINFVGDLNTPDKGLFWRLLWHRIPGGMDFDLGNNRPMYSTASMLYMTTHEERPQQPHWDYTFLDLLQRTGRARELSKPWGMDFAIGHGGFSLKVWDNFKVDKEFYLPPIDRRPGNQTRSVPIVPDKNHTIRLQIPSKMLFLMRGDTVHGGALQNKCRNGALHLHWYLSPGATNDQNIAYAKRDWNEIITDATPGDRTRLASYLVMEDGKQF